MSYCDSYENDDDNVFASLFTKNCTNDESDNNYLIRDNDPFMTSVQEEKYRIPEDEKNEVNRLKSIPIDYWRFEEVLFWLRIEAQHRHVTLHEMDVTNFLDIVDGRTLKQMSKDDFLSRSPKYGIVLYNSFQEFIKHEMEQGYAHQNITMPCMIDYLTIKPENDHYSNDQFFRDLDDGSRSSLCNSRSSCEGFVKYEMVSDDSEHQTMSSEAVRRKPGRPKGSRRKKKPEKLGRLWEFIRDLLLNPLYCPSLICWEDYEKGMFRFVSSDAVAKLWGEKKENKDMNYEKLSRAMRYYYKSEVLLPVLGRRLVYKFGPNAKNWTTADPNFRKRG